MKIAEPTTTLTDYLVGAVTLVMAIRLIGVARGSGETLAWLWAGGFLAASAAALLGGTAHGFAPHLSPGTQGLVWRASLYAIGFASLLYGTAVINGVLRPPLSTILVVVFVAKLALLAAWLPRHAEFKYVVYDYAVSMLIVLGLSAWAALSDQGTGYGWVAAAVVIAFAGAAVQRTGLTLHEHFNHNDLYHVIQLVSFFVLYRGARLILGA